MSTINVNLLMSQNIILNSYSNTSQTIFSLVLPTQNISVNTTDVSNTASFSIISPISGNSNISVPAVNVAIGTLNNNFIHTITYAANGISYNISVPFIANTTTPATNKPLRFLGTNLSNPAYYGAEFAFLNLFKGAGTNAPMGWDTMPTNGSYGDLKIDANCYVTSLTGNSGTVYSGVETFVFVNDEGHFAADVGEAPIDYPLGPYTFQFTGQGVVNILGDSNTITSVTNATFSGKAITSVQNGIVTVVFTGKVPQPDGGFVFTITSIPDSNNYPRNMSLVQNQYLSLYNAGEIFHPSFKLQIQNYGSLRFMDWNNVIPKTQIIYLGLGNVTVGNATANMQVFDFNNSVWDSQPWQWPTGNYTFTFVNGQTIANCAVTWNSSLLTFGSALTSNIVYPGQPFSASGWWQYEKNWASRSLPSWFCYSTYSGVPYEVCMQLANEMNVDAWLCYAPTQLVSNANPTDNTYIQGLANLANNGAGSQLTQFTSGVTNNVYIEFSNECWNFDYAVTEWSINMAQTFFNKTLNNDDLVQYYWLGVVQAMCSDIFFNTFGATQYNKRVFVSIGGQWANGGGGGPDRIVGAFRTPFWTSNAYSHHINCVHFAPYTPVNQMSQSDATLVLAQHDPLDTIFGLSYSNTYNGNTYTSISANGWIGDSYNIGVNTIFPNITGFPGVANLTYIGYEASTNWIGGVTDNIPAWLNLINSMMTDPRMEFVFYDPQNLLHTKYNYPASQGRIGYLDDCFRMGFRFVHHFSDQGIYNNPFGSFGAVQSSLDTLSPLNLAPPRYRGIQKWMIYG